MSADAMNDNHEVDPVEEWDESLAEMLRGASLLVGLTYLDHAGTLLRRRQVFGTVEKVCRRAGIDIRQRGSGEIVTIAPILDAIEVASPGIYQLADEDEVVENPDFTALVTVTSPLRH